MKVALEMMMAMLVVAIELLGGCHKWSWIHGTIE